MVTTISLGEEKDSCNPVESSGEIAYRNALGINIPLNHKIVSLAGVLTGDRHIQDLPQTINLQEK